MTGHCGGISLRDARNLNTMLEEGIDLNEHPILKALVEDLETLYWVGVKDYGYGELKEGYISKPRPCLDVRAR